MSVKHQINWLPFFETLISGGRKFNAPLHEVVQRDQDEQLCAALKMYPLPTGHPLCASSEALDYLISNGG